MSLIPTKKKVTTRRGFIKKAAVGAGGITLANVLYAVSASGQSEMKESQAKKSDYEKYILTPEIKMYKDLQVFELKGKDARGYDWAVQMAPVEAINLINETGAVNADRAKAYIGEPDNVKDIGTEIEISMGSDAEVHKIDSASVIYVPKGTPCRQHVLKKPAKTSFALTLTLPPKYVEPAKPKK